LNYAPPQRVTRIYLNIVVIILEKQEIIIVLSNSYSDNYKEPYTCIVQVCLTGGMIYLLMPGLT